MAVDGGAHRTLLRLLFGPHAEAKRQRWCRPGTLALRLGVAFEPGQQVSFRQRRHHIREAPACCKIKTNKQEPKNIMLV